MAWKKIILDTDVEQAMVMGVAGTLPAAAAADCADFLMIVPFGITLLRLKATVKTAVSSATTIQIRRSTDNGATFANYFGTVQIAQNAKTGVAAPVAAAVSEGDVLNFSITVGGGSGTNLMVEAIGRRT
jgi:hypothetical protein